MICLFVLSEHGRGIFLLHNSESVTLHSENYVGHSYETEMNMNGVVCSCVYIRQLMMSLSSLCTYCSFVMLGFNRGVTTEAGILGTPWVTGIW